MALPTLLVVVASVFGGVIAKGAYDTAKRKKEEEDAARQSAVDQFARTLQKGKNYAVQLMVDPSNPQWGGVKDLTTASALIKATFEQLGWRFLAAPAPRDSSAVASQKLMAGQPLEWVLTATWIRDEPYQAVSPGWAAMALPYLIPSA